MRRYLLASSRYSGTMVSSGALLGGSINNNIIHNNNNITNITVTSHQSASFLITCTSIPSNNNNNNNSSAFTSKNKNNNKTSTTTNTKPTVVVIGTGWAGARCARDINPKLCNIAVLSMRNHMVFTPLLPQTCSGTLEFRSICEPIIKVQPALAQSPNCFYRTMVHDIDLEAQVINCITVGVLGAGTEVPVKSFDFHYDKIVLAHGARPNTFNIPGVEEHAFFLREISEARGIRRRLAQNIITARLPTTSVEEIKRLLHVVVVGGGPTGVEFASDLADFLHQDIPNIDPALSQYFSVTLLEANEVLGTFEKQLRNYGSKRLKRLGIRVKKTAVARVTETSVVLTDGEVLPTGLVVWSTGVGPSPLSSQLQCDKTRQGRIAIDDYCRVLKDGKVIPNAYAIGDCAANVKQPLPTLAAVASRQGNYMAKQINALLAAHAKGKRRHPHFPHLNINNNNTEENLGLLPFRYKSIGSMVSLGRRCALVDLKLPPIDIKGILAFLVWRGAYLTMLGSMRSRLYVFINWAACALFGRDVTYIAEVSESKMWKTLAQEGASREQARRQCIKHDNGGDNMSKPPMHAATVAPDGSVSEACVATTKDRATSNNNNNTTTTNTTTPK